MREWKEVRKNDPVSRKNVKEGVMYDPYVLEKAVVEMASLKQEIEIWMGNWRSVHGGSVPTLNEVAETSPSVHKKFLRYAVLRDFVRKSD